VKTLNGMPLSDLASLSAAMRSGRLVPPYSLVSLTRLCPSSNTLLLAAELVRLDQSGWTPIQLAELADVIIAAKQPGLHAPPVELVWSGPEAAGIVNRDTGVVTRELFGKAVADVVVVGFAVHQGRDIFSRLTQRMIEIPALRVRLFLDIRRTQNTSGSINQLTTEFAAHFLANEWPGATPPELYFDPRSLAAEQAYRSSLHAKCVIVDRSVSLVTSANFTQAAQQRNIEVGALVHSPAFAAQLDGHFEKLVEGGVLERIPGC
jgi:hypothetical protein